MNEFAGVEQEDTPKIRNLQFLFSQQQESSERSPKEDENATELKITGTLAFVPASSPIFFNESERHKREKRALDLSLPLTSIEERYFGAMTDEHKLMVTYFSLLILQGRNQFALRAINLIYS
jgi:hypothetical protein